MDNELPTIEEIKRLDGKIFAMLNESEEIVFNFYRDRGRRYCLSVSVINEADPEELKMADSTEQADAVLKSANSRIKVVINK